MKDKKYFCYELYKNLGIWSHNGHLGYSPCSFYNGYFAESDHFDLESVWKGSERSKLLQQVTDDQPILGCQGCYTAEEHGLPSRRQSARQAWEDYYRDTSIDITAPQSIDYSVGNLCNLKCVICSPHNSSAWIPDYQKMFPLKSISEYQYDKYAQLEISDPALLKNIRAVHFHGGGEPLLSNNHVQLLKQIEQVKGLGDVRVFYNTNGTQKVNDQILELWSRCQLIEIYFSIDDIGSRFDYQRTGANWQQVLDNLDWYHSNMPHNHMFYVNCVWSYLNLFYLNELVDWHRYNFANNRFGDPTQLIFQRAMDKFNIEKISSQSKVVLETRFKNYPELLAILNSLSVEDVPSHAEFWNNITAIDKVRGTDYRQDHPYWSNLLLGGN
jgi:uncharacterized radical SAM superfamily Fe-S cluster-containing enzyme